MDLYNRTMNYTVLIHVFESKPSVGSTVFSPARHMMCVYVCMHIHTRVFLSLELSLLPILVRDCVASANYVVRFVENWQH